MKKNQGVFITIEGGEGAGKTTQTKLLFDYLSKKGYKVVLTFEPGATRIGGSIRKVLLEPSNKEISHLAELFLYIADRAQHVKEIIEPALKSGKIVICDRFFDATTAYQGFGRNIPLDLIDKLNNYVVQGIKPDLTLYFDIGTEEGLKRIKKRYFKNKKDADRIEKEKTTFHKNVRKGYLYTARKDPVRVKIIKAGSTIEKTFGLIKLHIDKLIGKKFTVQNKKRFK